MPNINGYTPKATPMEGLLNNDRPLCIRISDSFIQNQWINYSTSNQYQMIGLLFWIAQCCVQDGSWASWTKLLLPSTRPWQITFLQRPYILHKTSYQTHLNFDIFWIVINIFCMFLYFRLKLVPSFSSTSFVMFLLSTSSALSTTPTTR